MRRTPTAAVMLIALSLLACDGGEESAVNALAPTVRDSAGVRLVDHPGAVLDQEALALGAPVLVIGAADGEGADVFGAIGGVVRLGDGSIAVLDRQAAEVRVFAPDGALRTRFGRAGGGPGEFGQPSALIALPGDTLAVVDQFGYRVHRFAPDGRYLDGERLDATASVNWGVAGAFADGAWLMRSRTRSEGPPPDGRQDSWQLAGARSPGATTTDSLTRLRAGVAFFRNIDGGFSVWPVPFAPQGAVDVLEEGIVAHDGDRYAMRVVGRDATPRMIVRISAEPPVATEAHYTAHLEQQFGSMDTERRASSERDLAAIPREPRHGGFGRLRTDGEDRIWVAVVTPPSAVADAAGAPYLIFDGEGMIRGRVLLRETERVLQVDDTHLVTVGRDELDVEQVRVYALPEALRVTAAR